LDQSPTGVYVLSYHVDYWDRLGWRDRFAKREFTARQYRYASQWGNGSVYTPAFVLNGREWKDWSAGGGLSSPSATRAGKLRVVLDEKRNASATFTPATLTNDALQLHVALLGFDLESNVSRGENSGRKLHHDFVALATASANFHRAGETYSSEVALPNEQESGKPAALAAWISKADAETPIQATGGWLKP